MGRHATATTPKSSCHSRGHEGVHNSPQNHEAQKAEDEKAFEHALEEAKNNEQQIKNQQITEQARAEEQKKLEQMVQEISDLLLKMPPEQRSSLISQLPDWLRGLVQQQLDKKEETPNVNAPYST
jgi:hypothetical protein